jgi:autoinducer 2-degrading protein
MFVVAVHVFIREEKTEDFKRMIKANVDGSIQEPGCLRFDVAQAKDDATEFILWEVYVDEAANAFHKVQPHYLEFREKLPALQRKDRYSDLYEGVYVNSDKLP